MPKFRAYLAVEAPVEGWVDVVAASETAARTKVIKQFERNRWDSPVWRSATFKPDLGEADNFRVTGVDSIGGGSR